MEKLQYRTLRLVYSDFISSYEDTIQYNTKFIYIVGNTKQYNIRYE